MYRRRPRLPQIAKRPSVLCRSRDRNSTPPLLLLPPLQKLHPQHASKHIHQLPQPRRPLPRRQLTLFPHFHPTNHPPQRHLLPIPTQRKFLPRRPQPLHRIQLTHPTPFPSAQSSLPSSKHQPARRVARPGVQPGRVAQRQEAASPHPHAKAHGTSANLRTAGVSEPPGRTPQPTRDFPARTNRSQPITKEGERENRQRTLQ